MLTTDIIPITRFNRGGASSIFEEVKSNPKVVVKNNKPVCVLISPEAYDDMASRLKEASLYMDAQNNKNGLTNMRRMMEDIGITEAELERIEDIELD